MNKLKRSAKNILVHEDDVGIVSWSKSCTTHTRPSHDIATCTITRHGL